MQYGVLFLNPTVSMLTTKFVKGLQPEKTHHHLC